MAWSWQAVVRKQHAYHAVRVPSQCYQGLQGALCVMQASTRLLPGPLHVRPALPGTSAAPARFTAILVLRVRTPLAAVGKNACPVFQGPQPERRDPQCAWLVLRDLSKWQLVQRSVLCVQPEQITPRNLHIRTLEILRRMIYPSFNKNTEFTLPSNHLLSKTGQLLERAVHIIVVVERGPKRDRVRVRLRLRLRLRLGLGSELTSCWG